MGLKLQLNKISQAILISFILLLQAACQQDSDSREIVLRFTSGTSYTIPPIVIYHGQLSMPTQNEVGYKVTDLPDPYEIFHEWKNEEAFNQISEILLGVPSNKNKLNADIEISHFFNGDKVSSVFITDPELRRYAHEISLHFANSSEESQLKSVIAFYRLHDLLNGRYIDPEKNQVTNLDKIP